MTPLDLITRPQYLEEELAPAVTTYQSVLGSSSLAMPPDRDAFLDLLRSCWTNTLDRLIRHTTPFPRRRPQMAGPVEQRASHAAGQSARPNDAGAAEAALRAAVERAERAASGDEACYSVSEMHDAALDLAQAARALLNELETRHTR